MCECANVRNCSKIYNFAHYLLTSLLFFETNMQNIIDSLRSCDANIIKQGLAMGIKNAEILAIIDLYESIWNMTYGCSHSPDLIKMSLGDLEPRMALLNEQEDLMPQELTGVEWVTALDLGGFEDHDFFPELLRYKRLKHLDFWDNGLSDLPQDLYSLSTLESLRVCDDLRQLSPRISELKQLRKLDLADNGLETLPPSLQTLPHLAYIDLSGNYLDVFPEFLLQMPALQYLDVRNNTKNLVQPQIISDFERLGITILY